MQTTDLIILMLVVIDIVSLSMVTFIFRWARQAMGNFRNEILDLLSGETEESIQIIEKLGHTIYQKLYRYFNLQKGDNMPILSQESIDDFTKNVQSSAPGASPDLAKAASLLGINDPGFLKYLPVIMKLMNKNGSNSESVNTSSDSW